MATFCSSCAGQWPHSAAPALVNGHILLLACHPAIARKLQRDEIPGLCACVCVRTHATRRCLVEVQPTLLDVRQLQQQQQQQQQDITSSSEDEDEAGSCTPGVRTLQSGPHAAHARGHGAFLQQRQQAEGGVQGAGVASLQGGFSPHGRRHECEHERECGHERKPGGTAADAAGAECGHKEAHQAALEGPQGQPHGGGNGSIEAGGASCMALSSSACYRGSVVTLLLHLAVGVAGTHGCLLGCRGLHLVLKCWDKKHICSALKQFLRSRSHSS